MLLSEGEVLVRRNVRREGFTLLELLVAVALLGALVLVAAGLVMPLWTTRTSSATGIAEGLARSYLELIRARWGDATRDDFASMLLPSCCGAGTDLSLPAGWSAANAPKTDLERLGWSAIRGRHVGWSADDELRQVVVTVLPPGAKRSLSLRTYIVRPAP